MLSVLYTRQYVRLSVTRVDQSKTILQVRIMQFSPYGSPITLVFRVFHPKVLTGFPEHWHQQGRVGKTSHFLVLNVNISKIVEVCPRLLSMSNRKSLCAFD